MKNKEIKIGIIGQGYVGTAIKIGFEERFQVNTYDKYLKNLSTHNSIKSICESSDLIFLCLPTPMNENGSCHLNILDEVLTEINSLTSLENKIFAIKSTVPPGSSDNFKVRFKRLNIVYNPEFLREENYLDDFKNQEFIILGGDKKDIGVIAGVYQEIFPNIKIIKTETRIAEMSKNLINTFLATKVSFANEMKLICDKIKINYNDVIQVAQNDKRLGLTHWDVPGPDSMPGFGGSCFPKDINSIYFFSRSLNIDCNLIEAAIKTNKQVRPEMDWKKLKGRAVVDNE